MARNGAHSAVIGTQNWDPNREHNDFEAVMADWVATTGLTPGCGEDLDAWESALAAIAVEETALIERGRWIRGYDDLFSIAGISHNEVRHCRVLAWTLDPLGAHGLRSRMLDRLLSFVELDVDPDPNLTRVTVERARSESRADIIVEGRGWTIVIEAKVTAGEGDRQVERLHRDWEGEAVEFVFLTRNGEPPTSGPAEVTDRYRRLTWGEVIGWASDASEDTSTASGRAALDDWLRTARRVLTRR